MSRNIPIWQAEIVQGRLTLSDLPAFREYCRTLAGHPLEVVVRKRSKNRLRTDRQNRYYWRVVVTILSDYFGYEKDETHEALLAEYSRQRGGERRPGEPPTRIARSSSMTTVEFEDYMSWVRRWTAMEYAIMLPEPNEVMV